jgi:hypothetical protein
MASNPAPTKKRGPPPTGWGHQLSVRLQPAELARLDEWILAQPEPRPSRPEAMRRLVEQALGGPRAGSILIEDLNASNDE